MIEIQKNIPMPSEDGRQWKAKYPYRQMAIGDSFFVDKISRGSVYATGKYIGKTFTVREVDGGFRIWRTA